MGGWIGVCGDGAMEGVGEECETELGSPNFHRLWGGDWKGTVTEGGVSRKPLWRQQGKHGSNWGHQILWAGADDRDPNP